MAEKNTEAVSLRFGNWLPDRPTTPVAGLSYWGLAIAGIGILIALFLLFKTLWADAGLTLLTTLLVLVLVGWRFGPPEAGRTLLSRGLDRNDHRARRRRGSTLYSTGVFSRLPVDAQTALPGVLSSLNEFDGSDGFGKPFVMLEHPSAGTSAVTVSCNPDGFSMTPQSEVNQMVSQFGGWIASLSQDTALQGGVIVVDSARSGSSAKKQQELARVAAHAPQIAQDTLREVVDLMPDTVTHLRVFATLGWETRALGDTAEERVGQVSAKLPGYLEKLGSAGAGATSLCTSEDLSQVVQVAYRPSAQEEIENDQFAGRYTPSRVTTAGPSVFADTQKRWSWHDGFVSATAVMTIPPAMHITENSLEQMFGPHNGFLRKRVAVFYRPLSRTEAQRRALQLRRGAGMEASGQRGVVSAFATQRIQLAEKTESELTVGAEMSRFMIAVTVTVHPTPKAMKEAEARLKDLFGGTGMSWRWLEHAPAAAFHLTLPLGMMPWLWQSPIEALEGKL